jgi:uncharacterized protein
MSNAEVLGRFVWHELMTTDTAAAAAFYPKVVPWRTAPSSMPGYTIWMAGQTQIGGLMQLPSDSSSTPPHWLVYVGTPNVDATCSHAQSLGARVVKSPADIPNVGRFAVLADPQGATFALFAGAGSTPPGSPALGGFSWHELATTDTAGALRFYGELFGWRRGPAHDMGANMGPYQIFEHGGKQVGGMHAVQGPSTPPSWLSYINVGDVARAVAAAKAAGGRLLHGPMEVPGGSWIGLLMDPQGGAFAVHEAPRTAATQAKPAVAKAPASRPAVAAAAAVVKVAVAAKVAKKAVKKARKKVARKTARKVRRGGRKVARKARRAGRRVARKARRTGRRVARKARRGARKTARRVRARRR